MTDGTELKDEDFDEFKELLNCPDYNQDEGYKWTHNEQVGTKLAVSKLRSQGSAKISDAMPGSVQPQTMWPEYVIDDDWCEEMYKKWKGTKYWPNYYVDKDPILPPVIAVDGDEDLSDLMPGTEGLSDVFIAKQYGAPGAIEMFANHGSFQIRTKARAECEKQPETSNNTGRKRKSEHQEPSETSKLRKMDQEGRLRAFNNVTDDDHEEITEEADVEIGGFANGFQARKIKPGKNDVEKRWRGLLLKNRSFLFSHSIQPMDGFHGWSEAH